MFLEQMCVLLQAHLLRLETYIVKILKNFLPETGLLLEILRSPANIIVPPLPCRFQINTYL